VPSKRPGNKDCSCQRAAAAPAATAMLPALAPAPAPVQLACLCHHVRMSTVFLNLQSEAENSNQLMLVSPVLLQP